jgi:predicted GNAT superfamily acetyltransferase
MIEIWQLHDLEEFAEALKLQQRIWNFADIEAMPLRWFIVASRVGGQVFGAYEDGQMIGFLGAMPGILPDGQPYLHSHMLGVLPKYRDRGVGRRLKLAQRDEALARGIERIEWTFDPLELKNAYFNIERLGAIVREYVENLYGVTASPLHGGLPTDRCSAEWWLRSPRVEAAAAGKAAERGAGERIVYPADIAHFRANDPARARAVQSANGEKFRDAFARGLAVTGFERIGGAGVYLLERVEKAVPENDPAPGERVRPIEKKTPRNFRRGGADDPEAA